MLDAEVVVRQSEADRYAAASIGYQARGFEEGFDIADCAESFAIMDAAACAHAFGERGQRMTQGFACVQLAGSSDAPSTTSCPVPAFIGAAPRLPDPHHFVHSTGPFPEFSAIATVTQSGGLSPPSCPAVWLGLALVPALGPALGAPLEPPVTAAVTPAPTPPPTIIPAATAAMRFLFNVVLPSLVGPRPILGPPISSLGHVDWTHSADFSVATSRPWQNARHVRCRA
jgi:hypothetical protein